MTIFSSKQNVSRYLGTSLFKLVEKLLNKVLWTDRQTDGQTNGQMDCLNDRQIRQDMFWYKVKTFLKYLIIFKTPLYIYF